MRLDRRQFLLFEGLGINSHFKFFRSGEAKKPSSPASSHFSVGENSGIFLVVDQDRTGGSVHDFGCPIQIEQPSEKCWMVTPGNDQISTQIACQR
jgi:hypothetical protein